MSTNNALHQLNNTTPEGGENVLIPRSVGASGVGLLGTATRIVASDSLAVDAVLLDAAAEGIVFSNRITDDIDLDPETARMRFQMVCSLVSGTSVTLTPAMNGIFTGQGTFAASVGALGVTTPAVVVTGTAQLVEFNLDIPFRTALKIFPAAATAVDNVVESIAIAVTATVAGLGVIHAYDFTAMNGSMIVPSALTKR